jgi:hypothetical protein
MQSDRGDRSRPCRGVGSRRSCGSAGESGGRGRGRAQGFSSDFGCAHDRGSFRAPRPHRGRGYRRCGAPRPLDQPRRAGRLGENSRGTPRYPTAAARDRACRSGRRVSNGVTAANGDCPCWTSETEIAGVDPRWPRTRRRAARSLLRVRTTGHRILSRDVHRDSMASDNRRQNRLLNAGVRLLRFTASDVFRNPAGVAMQVRTMLAA